jgi:hypothetical protein
VGGAIAPRGKSALTPRRPSPIARDTPPGGARQQRPVTGCRREGQGKRPGSRRRFFSPRATPPPCGGVRQPRARAGCAAEVQPGRRRTPSRPRPDRHASAPLTPQRGPKPAARHWPSLSRHGPRRGPGRVRPGTHPAGPGGGAAQGVPGCRRGARTGPRRPRAHHRRAAAVDFPPAHRGSSCAAAWSRAASRAACTPTPRESDGGPSSAAVIDGSSAAIIDGRS